MTVEIKKENVVKAYQEGCADVRTTLKVLFPELESWIKPKITLQSGTYWYFEETNRLYILYQTRDRDRWVLVNMRTGNRFQGEPTADEMMGKLADFEQVSFERALELLPQVKDY